MQIRGRRYDANSSLEEAGIATFTSQNTDDKTKNIARNQKRYYQSTKSKRYY